MPIRILDAATVGRIAAGEVVERPASVVKELLENSLDAGATSLTVEIRDGGISYLRVTDNGCGIEPGQVRLAFENHATSKLMNAAQLSDIRTMGFRGEALPSIAAVSRVEMTTRAARQDTGARLTVEGGENVRVREIGCPEGTTVVVRDLFFNLPVRKGFLKRPQYEAALVNDTVARLILGNPRVSFRFINSERTVYHSFGDGELRHAIFAVYGREAAEAMVDVDTAQGGMRIYGMIGVGEQAKTTRAHEAFFINGRSVRCALLQQALEAVCRERVTVGMYPMCALNLTLPPTSVDVNVHPNKLEVRFRDEAATRLAAEAMLRAALEGEGMLARAPERPTEFRPQRTVEEVSPPVLEQQQMPLQQTEVETIKTEVENSRTEVSKKETEVKQHVAIDAAEHGEMLRQMVRQERERLRHAGPVLAAALREDALPVTAPSDAAEEFTQTAAANAPPTQSAAPSREEVAAATPHRVIGVLFRTYILLEWGEALLMIDQHAAHERLRYEQLSRAVDEGVASQQLLTPEIVRLSAREMALVEENMDALSAVGYDLSPFGEHDMQIRAVPHILGRAELRPRFMEVLEGLSGMGSAALEARREEILQRACKGAVKAGDALSDSEISALLRQMELSGAPPTCPHGRPVVRTLTRREIERMFKRIQ